MSKKYNSILASAVILLVLPSVALGQGSPNVQLLAHVNSYPSIGYNDCWGYTAPDGREYALLGVLNGTSIVDITDAPTVNEVRFIPSPNSLWKDIKTYRHYAYVVNESSGGLQIIDLSYLPDSARLANVYTGFSTSHNISIDTANALLYAEGNFSEPVRVLSLADPLNPIQVSAFGIPSHDIYGYNNIAYVSEGSNGSISVYNLANPSNPTLMHRFSIPQAGYVHNAWLSDYGNYLMTTEETAGKTVKLWNISNLDSVHMTDEYLASPYIAHNTHLKGNYAYISHYADGLRIVDMSNPFNIFEAGYYDTYPGAGGGFNGAWGAFPFFASGKVLISDMQTGLYVVFFAGTVSAGDNEPSLPQRFAVSQNYPNPFNPSTTIRFDLPVTGPVQLVVYNMLGQKVRTLVHQTMGAGTHMINWDGMSEAGASVSSGVYLYRFDAEGFTQTHRMVLVR